MTFHKHISGASWGELVSWLKCLDPPQDSHHHISPQLWRRSLILQPQEMFITVSKVYNFLIIALQAYSAFTHCNLLLSFPISILQFSHVSCVLRSDALWTSCVACWCILNVMCCVLMHFDCIFQCAILTLLWCSAARLHFALLAPSHPRWNIIPATYQHPTLTWI